MEVKELLDSLRTSFEQFKKANDERLDSIEKNGKPNAELEAKAQKWSEEVSKLQARIDELEKKGNRFNGNQANEQEALKAEHKAAFVRWMRKGKEDGLRDLERKALNVTTDAEGGYAVPENLDRTVLNLLKNVSPMRQLANVITIGGGDYKKLVNISGTTSGWVDEDDERTETTAPQLAQITPYMGEVYANPSATQTMLDDSFFDVEGWLAQEVADEFALEESDAFVNGSGTKKPKGFLAYTMANTADGTRAFGQIQYIASGTSAAINNSDKLLDMVYALKAGHRTGAVFQGAKLTYAAIRKLKDGNGNYIWQPSMQAGQPSSLLGYPAIENEDMPAIASNSYSLAFGNFKAGYTIVDRFGIRTLRDPYTNKPYVLFYSTKRVGGMVADSEAIKILKCAAS
jgi:HK97 family phage major capsid protein